MIGAMDRMRTDRLANAGAFDAGSEPIPKSGYRAAVPPPITSVTFSLPDPIRPVESAPADTVKPTGNALLPALSTVRLIEHPAAAANDSFGPIETAPERGSSPQSVKPDSPPLASLLMSPARVPSDARSIPAAASPEHAATPAKATAVPRFLSSSFNLDRLRHYLRPGILYAALLPAVIVGNLGYDSIKHTVHEWMNTKAGVADLQKQVAELKKRDASPALPAERQPVRGGPLHEIAPEALTGAGYELPSPLSTGKPIPEVVDQPKKAAKHNNESKDESPESDDFVLFDANKQPASNKSEQMAPGEFKLLGDK